MPRATRRGLRRKAKADSAPVAGSRLRILEGGMRAFGERGYTETRVEDILRAAGVSRPTFYKFFANRDEVLDAICESQAFSVIQSMKGAIAIAADPIERLDKGLDAYLRWRATIGPMGSVFVAEAMRPGSHASQLRSDITEVVTSWIRLDASEVLQDEPDPLLYDGIVAALERVSADLDRGRVGEREIQRCKYVMTQIVLGTLAWDRDRDALIERVARMRRSKSTDPPS